MIDCNSNIIQIPRPLDADLLRKAIVNNALSIENITASNNRKKFEELLGPINGKWDLSRPFKVSTVNGKTATQGISTCGLVCSSLWRRMNIDFNPLYKAYVFGTAIQREISFAKSLKPRSAFQKPEDGLKPEPGDYVVIGSGYSTHVLTCIDWNDNKLISIDGGQTDKNGLQAILRKERIYSKKNNKYYLGDREVLGWIVFDMLPFKDDFISVPEGY